MQRSRIIIIFLMIFSLFGLFFLPLLGRTMISPSTFLYFLAANSELRQTDPLFLIFWNERFPKTLLSMLAGSGLALSGMTLQAIFRNPLTTPYTLGIASGAAFGASLSLTLGTLLTSCGVPIILWGLTRPTWFAFGGSLLAMGIVYLLSRIRSTSSDQLLLAGVAVSFFFSSLVLSLQYIADPTKTFRILRWTMGGIDFIDIRHLVPLIIIILAYAAILFYFSRELNILLTGQEQAISLGVEVGKVRIFLFFLSSMTVGAIVAICGPIGFVGLMVPHLCRFWVGSDHYILTPVVFFFGAIFLAVCYTISRTLFFATVLPVGIITSLLGGPFFLILLLNQKKT